MDKNEISVIDKFASNPTEDTMQSLIELSKSEEFTDEGIATLARRLAYSGHVLSLPNINTYADIPSTGGPSSLSTLLCPLALVEKGFYVPKLGVSGRPAGGIDVLYQIPNYKILFSPEEIKACLNENNYCHFQVGEDFAPLDNLLFNYRGRVAAKAVPALVIASILAKKIAVGLDVTGLDVRVAEHGNFGHDWSLAKQNSIRFIRVAELLGIKAKCFLNNNNLLFQPHIGRGESLIALHKIFMNQMQDSLKDHLLRCIDMALNVGESKEKGIKITTESLKKRFVENLVAQGSSYDRFEKRVDKLINEHVNEIKSKNSGFLKINLSALRDTIVSFQKKVETEQVKYADPCGVIFKKKENEYVEEGEVILTYRVASNFHTQFQDAALSLFEIKNDYQQSHNYEIIN